MDRDGPVGDSDRNSPDTRRQVAMREGRAREGGGKADSKALRPKFALLVGTASRPLVWNRHIDFPQKKRLDTSKQAHWRIAFYEAGKKKSFRAQSG